jgi:hypothetical protein
VDEKDHPSLLLAAVEPYACLQVAEEEMDAAVSSLDTEESSLSPVILVLLDPLREDLPYLETLSAEYKGHGPLIAAAPGIGVDLDMLRFHDIDVLQGLT